MFQGKRYITRSVNTEIPFELQLLLWGLIDCLILDGKKVDHLQVFRINSLDNVIDQGECLSKLKIVHSQERPRYKREYTIISTAPVNTKIFVIDDTTHSTMMLAEEY